MVDVTRLMNRRYKLFCSGLRELEIKLTTLLLKHCFFIWKEASSRKDYKGTILHTGRTNTFQKSKSFEAMFPGIIAWKMKRKG